MAQNYSGRRYKLKKASRRPRYLAVKLKKNVLQRPSSPKEDVSSDSEPSEEQKDSLIEEAEPKESSEPNDQSSKENYSSITKDKTKGNHTCELCSTTFDRKSKLASHMFKHSNSRPYKCAVCSKTFKTGAYLSRHAEIHDDPLRLHACSLCEFQARTKPYLKVHYIRKHTQEYNYSCEQCGKLFKVQSDYTTHVKDHDAESCVCDICGASYGSKSSLYFHKYYKHKTKVKDFECGVCKKRFKNQKNLDSHVKLHEIKYVCEQCGMEFKFKYGLTKHLRTHSAEKSYLCAICGKTFGCLSSQKIHLLTHVGERPYICDICGQSYTQRTPMMLHRKKHPGSHPPPPPIKITNLLHGVQDMMIVNKPGTKLSLEERRSKSSLSYPSKRKDESRAGYCTKTNEESLFTVLGVRKLSCDLCGKTFEHKSKMLRHINSKHSLRRPFECTECEKSFKYKCDLKAHQRVHLEPTSQYACANCSYRAQTKNNLKTHYIRRHTSECKFSCEHCGKTFKLEWDLKFHLGTHAHAQTMCDICGRFYASEHALYKHRKVVHLNTYMYTCGVCNKKLMTQRNLEVHLATQHNQSFECKVCGKRFALKKYLRSHSLIHKSDRPFACHVCDKRFRTLNSANTHMRAHSSEKPFICDLCGQAFKRRASMKQHRKKHPEDALFSTTNSTANT